MARHRKSSLLMKFLSFVYMESGILITHESHEK